MSMQNLPSSWRLVSLEELIGDDAPIVYGIIQAGPEVAGGVPYVRPTELTNDRINTTALKRTSEAIAARYKRSSLKTGDIVLAIVGTIGKLAIVPPELDGANITQSSARLRPPERMQPEYLCAVLKSPQLRQQFDEMEFGVAVRRLNIAHVRALKIPVAPTNEQRRIVAKLEAVQSSSRRARQALDAVPPLLARLRQSILAAAFRGDLTADWRSRHPNTEPATTLLARIRTERREKWEEAELAKLKAKGKAPTDDRWKTKYNEPAPVDTTGLPELPSGWCWVSLGELAWDAGYGTSAKCDYEGTGLAVLRIPNIARGRLDFSDLKRALTETNDADLLVATGDLLIVRTNGSRDLIGKAAVVADAPPEPTSFASYLIRFRLGSNDVLARWVGRCWESPFVRSQVVAHAASSAGQYNVSLTELSGCVLPLAPSAEQREIADRLATWLDLQNNTERGLSDLLSNLAKMEQSTLAKAFRGELVPQDPNDEPADQGLQHLDLHGAAEAREPTGTRRRKKREARGARQKEA